MPTENSEPRPIDAPRAADRRSYALLPPLGYGITSTASPEDPRLARGLQPVLNPKTFDYVMNDEKGLVTGGLNDSLQVATLMWQNQFTGDATKWDDVPTAAAQANPAKAHPQAPNPLKRMAKLEQ